MTPVNQERLKGLLGVIVRRHTRHGQPSHPVGQLIADEARRLHGDSGLSGVAANDEANRQLVDRLYRRFLLPRHSTVEAAVENDSLVLEEIHS
jgi:hypothetical protein